VFKFKHIKMKRKITNENYFQNIDCDLKAYLLGFFLADGCVTMNSGCKNSYKLSINISEIDKDIVELYQQTICPNNKITISNYTKGAKNRKPTYQIKWTSNIMKKDLENFNIYPRKTQDLNFEFPFEKLNTKFHFSFIRGFFDGDNALSYETNKIQFTFAFYATSKLFLEQIGNLFKKEFNTDYKITSCKKSTMILYQINFNSNRKRRYFIEKLYNKMYNNSEFSLKRKRLKFESYLNTVLNKETKKSLSV